MKIEPVFVKAEDPLIMPFLIVTMVALFGTLLALYGIMGEFGSAIIGVSCIVPLVCLDILRGV